MMSVKRLLVVLLMGMPMVASQALAQSEQAGPFEFQVDLRGEYTDNRDSSEVKEKNFDFYIKPRIDIDHESDTTVIDAYYAPAYRWRDNPADSQNDTELQQELAIRLVHNPVPRIKLRANEQFFYTDDPGITKGGSNLRRDSSYALNRVDGGVNYEFSRRKNIDVSARHQMKRYDDTAVAQESDEDHVGGGVSVWNQFQRTMGGLLGVDYGVYDYKSSVGLDRGFEVMTGILGLEKILTKTLRMGGRIGYQVANYNDDRLSEMTAPYANLSIQGSTTPALKLTLNVTHGLRDSDVYPYASQEYTEFDGRVEYDVEGPLSYVLVGTYRHGIYDSETVPGSALPEIVRFAATDGTEDTLSARAEVAYQVNPLSTIRLGQMYETVDSEVSVDFDRNTTMLVFGRKF